MYDVGVDDDAGDDDDDDHDDDDHDDEYDLNDDDHHHGDDHDDLQADDQFHLRFQKLARGEIEQRTLLLEGVGHLDS